MFYIDSEKFWMLNYACPILNTIVHIVILLEETGSVETMRLMLSFSSQFLLGLDLPKVDVADRNKSLQ
jgi:hypothetical protein